MRIHWTEPAIQDFTYICDQSTIQFGDDSRSRRTALRIYEAVDSLTAFPHIGRPGRKPGTSELVISALPFVVIYRLKNDSIEIVRILHGAQKWP